MRKYFFLLFSILALLTKADAQGPSLDSVKTVLFELNRIFDSSRYLAFDVNMRYNTDTSFGRFDADEQTARYVINDRHIYFAMGDDEYVQTDSFLFTIYREDKLMVMTPELAVPVSNKFPLREFLDSVVTIYDSAYAIKISAADSVHTISFIAKSDTVPYSKFVIAYQADSFLPLRFELETLGEMDLSEIPDSLVAKVALKKVRQRLEMEFVNYSFPDDLNVFKVSSYVLFDRFRKVYKVAPKYQGFRLITNGVGSNNIDPYAELLPPPGGEPEPVFE